MINFDYIRPSTQKAALDAVGRDNNARFIAGGTNLVDLMKHGIASPQKLVDITGLPLDTVERSKGWIRIGALVRNSTLAEHPLITEHLPLLSMALKAGASPQIRNMATTGGNLMQRTRCPYFYDTALPCNKRTPGSGCGALKGYNRMHAILGASDQCIAVHPSDLCVALAALDARVVLAGAKGQRVLPFSDFHRLPGNTPEKDNNLLPGELILAVEVPEVVPGKVHYLKVRDRASYAFALVSVAVHVPLQSAGSGSVIRGARIALGGVAHKPWRLKEAEAILETAQPSEALFRRAAEAGLKNARGYGSNNFKLKLAPNAVVQALKTACELS